MSTLEVACGRCDRRFRVRAEFAGRSTRCPGCSAPITVAGAAPPAPKPRTGSDDRPAPRPRRRDEDDEPARPTGDWAPVERAFRQEQVAVVFLLVAIVLSCLMFCLMRATRSDIGSDANPFFVIVLAAPALAAAAAGLMARISALRVPPESFAKGSATASLVCALGALATLILQTLALLVTLESHGDDGLPAVVGTFGLVLTVVGALVTFGMFTAQVGIARRSLGVSRGLGQLAVTVCVCAAGLVGVAALYTLATGLTAPAFSRRGAGAHEGFFLLSIGFLLPVALGVVLVLYHRLLAAGRRAVQGEPAGRYDG